MTCLHCYSARNNNIVIYLIKLVAVQRIICDYRASEFRVAVLEIEFVK